MADKVITSTGDCSACCGGGACECALVIPTFLSPYSSYSAAATAISDGVGSCLVYYIYYVFVPPNSLTADNSVANELSISIDVDDVAVIFASITVGAATTLTIPFSQTIITDPVNETFGALLYSCDDGGTEIDSDLVSGATGTATLNIPAAGTYYVQVRFEVESASPPLNINGTCTIESSTDCVFNPVIAKWDDGGTTRNLWACPKLLLPPLTEDTGTWYADATAAADAITNLTSNCVGCIESLTNVSSFTATDGGTSLDLANTLTAGAMTSPRMWGGLNVEDTKTLTVTATVGAGTASLNANIYDDTGTLVEASGTVSSPWTSAAVGYTGRYTVSVAVTSSSNTTSMSAAITSSGTISVNPAQALYDIGLTCPARLDC